MPYPDLPQPPRPAKENVHYVQKKTKHLELPALNLDKPGTGSSKMNTASLESLGQIEQMSLPSGWTAGQRQDNLVGDSSYQEYLAPEQNDVKLCFYYRGYRVSKNPAESFRAVLAKDEHKLSNEEIVSLSEVLRNKDTPEQFKFSEAKTVDLNGKRVLLVSGQYVKSNKRTEAIYIDADGTGSACQEVFFQAPADVYDKYIETARDSFKSIEWK